MDTQSQIEQALEVVKSHPGDPVYAWLAEQYLESGALDQARAVCDKGFAANPGLERGAVVYLAVLRQQKDLRRASEVFGRAVAYLPRSAELRLGWALILMDAGKEREARHLAREAQDLDPASEQAKNLVSLLGGTPTPYIFRQRPASSPETGRTPLPERLSAGATPPPPLDPRRQAPAVGGPQAEVRPWVRPIGQRTTPHSMFDLTPAPVLVPDSQRRGLHQGEVSIFDIHAPSVEDEQQLVEDDLTNLDMEVPPDLFDDPFFTPSPEDLDGGVPQPPAEIQVAAAQPPPTPSTAVQAATAAPPPPISPPGVHQPTAAPPPPIGQESPESLPPRGAAARESRRRVMLLAAVGVLVAALSAAGVFGYLHLLDRLLQRDLQQIMIKLQADTRVVYEQARAALQPLVREHPETPAAAAALALVEAHLWARFSGPEELHSALSQRLEQLQRQPAPPADAQLAAALLQLHQGRPGEAEQALKLAQGAATSWHYGLALAWLQLTQSKVDQAVATLERAAEANPGSAALTELLAQTHRRLGRYHLAEQELKTGLSVLPHHPGLQIQLALVLAARDDQAPEPETIAQLEQQAGDVGRYQAALLLLAGQQAWRAQRHEQARQLAAKAHALQPRNAEIATTLASWQLGPGGLARQAADLLERYGEAMAAYSPDLHLELVRAQLLIGRPHQACARLADIATGSLSPGGQLTHAALRVECADRLEQRKVLYRLCRPTKLKGNLQRKVRCAEALLDRSKLRSAASVIHRVGEPQASLYLSGLRALTLGDAATAIQQLSRTPPRLDVAGARPLLALAEAFQQQGNIGKAVQLLRQAVPLDANSLRSRVALASALIAGGHDTEATLQLETILDDRPTQPTLLAQAGQALLTLGHTDKAQALIAQAEKHTRSAAAVQLLAGQVALVNGERNEAEEHFRSVLKGDAQNPDALIALGQIELATGKADQARKHFATALKLRPKDPELLMQVAKAQTQAGAYRQALDLGLKSIRAQLSAGLKAQAYGGMVELGQALAKGDAWAKARAGELFFEATKPKNPPAIAFLELGRLHHSQGDMARAVWCFRRATEVDPQWAEAFFMLGQALRSKKRWRKEAPKAFRRYLELQPEGEHADEARALLSGKR